jgi:hypothetical protein
VIVVRWIRAFVGFWIDFILGDDWTAAATVLAALVATWGLERGGVPAWWLLPAAAVGITAFGLRRAAMRSRKPPP